MTAPHDGRYRGILNPDEFYLSTPELRRRTRAEADRLGVGITMHFCEQLFEFHETVRLTGRTPVQNLADEGFLAPDVLLGHCIYVAGHPMVAYPWDGDLELIAASGATVAHAPLALARRGVFLSTFDRYRKAGINIGMGTDSYPYDLIAEMRMGSLAGKIVGGDNEAAKARAVFDAATLGGAKALGRERPRPDRAGRQGGHRACRFRRRRHWAGLGPDPQPRDVRVRQQCPHRPGRRQGRRR